MSNLIDLTKKAKIVLEKKNLVGVQADIVLAIDCSGSMDSKYRNGEVQNTVNRLLGIGMNMDANKSIDVFQFNGGYKYIGTATEANHMDFVKNNRMRADGGTNYAPVMNAILDKFDLSEKRGFLGGLFGKKKESSPNNKATHPVFVFYITDGNNFDKDETEKVIRESATKPVFWQFIGIGHEKFSFLQELDDLSGRYVDNADFFKVADISKLSDEELYQKLLNEFPGWLKEVKEKGMLPQ